MTAVIFGSTTGNTETAARQIAEALGGAEVLEVSSCTADKLNSFDRLIFGTSTWGIGDLQDDWESGIGLLANIDYSGKTIALFGLGDQEGYPDSFVDGMGTLRDKITAAGGSISGAWPVEGYNFDSSTAVDGDSFAGLALDEDNQSHLSEDRIKEWVALL